MLEIKQDDVFNMGYTAHEQILQLTVYADHDANLN